MQESLQIAAAHLAQAGDVTLGHQDTRVCEAMLGGASCGSSKPKAALLDTAEAAFKVCSRMMT